MRFRSFLLAEDQHDLGPDVMGGDDLNSDARSQINTMFDVETNVPFSSPEAGVQMVRRVLGSFGVEFPALYGLDPEGNEIVVSVGDNYLYMIYSLADNGSYDFYAELVDDEELVDILSDEGDEEEE